ncbi:MAG: HD domain-containing protein [Planctomycetes bacterium]|nr:HD domain-containing protein [Planctomycetota bacterium]
MESIVLDKAVQSPVNLCREYTRIPLKAIRLKIVENVDLYCKPRDGNTPILYCSGNYPICDRDIDELERRGEKALYVSPACFAEIQRQLFESLDELISDERISPTDRFSLLQTAVSLEIDMSFRLIKIKSYESLSRRVAENIVSLLESNSVLPRQLFQVVQHDFYTFTHVTNVAGFAVMLAERLSISSGEDLRSIASGALLHDVGKRFIPSNVLSKPGRLSEAERQLIEMHPLRGFVDLRTSSNVDFEQLLMVYQHHERIDGKGYPVRLVGDEIHPWARLLTVVDVFDALTSKRPYRDAMRLSDALDILESGAGTHFDKEMVQCWISAIRES